jgi:FAD dependent oxidoreductase
MNRALPVSAEVVVIGGGVIGVSALYHLAAAGCASAILIEREVLGSGSTAAAAGGIRAQFSDELNVRTALECIRRFERFEDEIGVDIEFKQWGYLFLLEAGDVAEFRRSVDLQHRLGVPVRMVSPTDAFTHCSWNEPNWNRSGDVLPHRWLCHAGGRRKWIRSGGPPLRRGNNRGLQGRSHLGSRREGRRRAYKPRDGRFAFGDMRSGSLVSGSGQQGRIGSTGRGRGPACLLHRAWRSTSARVAIDRRL